MRGRSRYLLIISFAAALGAILCGRLFILTVAENDKWQSYADDVSLRAVYETAPRGDILDRNGDVIATSRPVYSVSINRVNTDDKKVQERAEKTIELLKQYGENMETTADDVSRILSARGYNSYLPVMLSENVSPESVRKLSEEYLPGVRIAVNYIREYPQGALASHVVGYLGRISPEDENLYVKEKGYRKDALIGKAGIEKIYEDRLKGSDAVSRLQIDSLGNASKFLGRSNAVKGEDIMLTLDMELQRTAEDALQQSVKQAATGGTFKSRYGDVRMSYAENAEVGAAVVIDVRTGEVLALANYPDFDPNDFAVAVSKEKWASLQQKNKNDPLSAAPLYNVAAMSAVQPGSTFKPVTAMAALECGLDKNRYLYDDGYVKLGNRTYGCHLWNDKKQKHGYVNLSEALKVSCNYYFYDIASGNDFAKGKSLDYHKKINNDIILNYAGKMGLGQKTGIEIGESAGVLPTEKVKNDRIKKGLENYIYAERETYFVKSAAVDQVSVSKVTEKILNWSNRGLTLEEIIGKLKREKTVKRDKVYDLACVCKYDYFDQMGWTQGDTFNISIGQGDNAYTTLQMANYMATLGNGGTRNKVSLILGSLQNQKQSTLDSADKIDSFSDSEYQENLKYLINAMTEVTESDGGSLRRAFLGFPYSVAAKTGTAQRAGRIGTKDEKDYIRRHLHLIAPDVSFRQAEDEARRLMNEYPGSYKTEDRALRRAVINLSRKNLTYENLYAYKKKYDSFAWTVALAPAENPQIAVAVMLVQGKTSSNAAPAAREIIGRYGEDKGWEKSF